MHTVSYEHMPRKPYQYMFFTTGHTSRLQSNVCRLSLPARQTVWRILRHWR